MVSQKLCCVCVLEQSKRNLRCGSKLRIVIGPEHVALLRDGFLLGWRAGLKPLS
jgi:hypothetical protein